MCDIDEYVEEYLYSVATNPCIEHDELLEVLETYIADRARIDVFLKINENIRKESDEILATQDTYNKRITIEKEHHVDKHRCFEDQKIKKSIIAKYDLQEIKVVGKDMTLPSYLDPHKKKKKPEKCVRYLNNQIVTCKGEKYIVDKDK